MKFYPNVVRIRFQEHASIWIARSISLLSALLRIPSRIANGRPFEAFHLWLDRYPLVRELLSEVCSLGHRIEMICKESVWRDGVDLGRAFGTESDADGFLLPCIETERRTLGIEMLQSKYPWVSSMDMQLFLLGFEAAESMPCHNSCNKSEFRISIFSPNSPTPSTPTPSASLPLPLYESL
jgi:hypothetical protein